MIPDMRVRTRPETRAVILLQTDQFDLITRVLGCESDQARADLIGMTARQLYRARRGDVGGQFVANTLATFRRYERELAARNLRGTFESVFRVAVVGPKGIEVEVAA